MKFTKIKANNFMQFHELDLDLSNKGLCLIQGEIEGESFTDSNTAGKTTAVVNSLLWCLFGETLSGLKGDDVINDSTGKDCFVSIKVEKDGVEYLINRYRKHKIHKNDLTFNKYENKESPDVCLTKSSNAETQEEINKIFNINWNIVINTMLFGQGNVKRFSELGDSDRKKLLDDVLNLSIIQDYQSKVKVKIKELNIELVNLTKNLDKDKASGLNYKNLLDNLDKDTDKFLKEKSNSIQLLNLEIDALKSKLTAIEDQAIDVDDTWSKINKLGELLAIITEHEASLELLISNINNINLSIRTEAIQRDNIDKKIKIINLKIDNIQKDAREDCDSCGQAITENSKNSFITKYRLEIATLEEDKEKNTNNINNLNKKLELLTNKYNIIKTKIAKKNEITKCIYELENKIKTLNINKSLIDSIKASIKDKESQIEVLSKKDNPYSKLKNTYAIELKSLENCIIEIDKNIEIINNELEYLKFWEVGFSNTGIKSLMLDSIVPILTDKTNYYLDYLTKGEIKILFDTQSKLKNTEEKRDKLDIKLFKNGKEYVFEKTSGGEKRRIDICISLALQSLNSNLNSYNIMIFDEVFDSLDETGVDCVINLLEEEIKHKNSIFVISHNSHIKNKFRKCLTVRKICDISKVYEN